MRTPGSRRTQRPSNSGATSLGSTPTLSSTGPTGPSQPSEPGSELQERGDLGGAKVVHNLCGGVAFRMPVREGGVYRIALPIVCEECGRVVYGVAQSFDRTTWRAYT